jgi:hypothetical protein
MFTIKNENYHANIKKTDYNSYWFKIYDNQDNFIFGDNGNYSYTQSILGDFLLDDKFSKMFPPNDN